MPAARAKPISDLMLDWMTLLQRKGTVLRAYRKYIRDAEREDRPDCAALFRQLHAEEAEQVARIEAHIERLLDHRTR